MSLSTYSVPFASVPFAAGVALRHRRDLFAANVAGIRVSFAWDLLFVLTLPVIGVIAGGKPYGVAGGPGLLWGIVASVLGVAFVVSLALHELAHAVVARRVGLRVRGVRLSMLGGAAEIGADFHAPANECAIALAGLGVSTLLGIVAGGLALLLHGRSGPLFALCVGIAAINGVLVGLNALPGFPLDGGRILRAAAWYLSDDLIAGTQIAAGYAQFVSWAVLALGLVVLFYAPVFGVWLAIMGYYIGRAGRAAYAQLLWQETSRTIPLEAITGPGPLLAADKTIGDVVEVFLGDRWGGPRPVGRDGMMIGVLDLETNVRCVPRVRWAETTVAAAMTPIDALPRLTVGTGKTLYDGLKLLDERGIRAAAAVDAAGEVRGLVTRERIDRWVRQRVRETTAMRVRRPPRLPF